MDAKAYYDLIDWQIQVTEPPLLKQVSNEEFESQNDKKKQQNIFYDYYATTNQWKEQLKL